MFFVPEDHVHRHTVVEEVGEPEHQIVVQDEPPLVNRTLVAACQHIGPAVARQHRKHTGRQLVADVIHAVVAEHIAAAEAAPGAARAEQPQEEIED